MHRKFQDILHSYKVDNYKVDHGQKDVQAISDECMTICEDVLEQHYNYHFHKLPDAGRAEIINMINNYTREAILPPVVNKLVERQVKLEHRVDNLVHLIEEMLEALSTDPASV